ncbi:hypothetical protein HK102_001591 [Quaeritorhiza haematococci]|nr:hypothetical protein HK102_001591 [Quaeritorhiza haematococci]
MGQSFAADANAEELLGILLGGHSKVEPAYAELPKACRGFLSFLKRRVKAALVSRAFVSAYPKSFDLVQFVFAGQEAGKKPRVHFVDNDFSNTILKDLICPNLPQERRKYCLIRKQPLSPAAGEININNMSLNMTSSTASSPAPSILTRTNSEKTSNSSSSSSLRQRRRSPPKSSLSGSLSGRLSHRFSPKPTSSRTPSTRSVSRKSSVRSRLSVGFMTGGSGGAPSVTAQEIASFLRFAVGELDLVVVGDERQQESFGTSLHTGVGGEQQQQQQQQQRPARRPTLSAKDQRMNTDAGSASFSKPVTPIWEEWPGLSVHGVDLTLTESVTFSARTGSGGSPALSFVTQTADSYDNDTSSHDHDPEHRRDRPHFRGAYLQYGTTHSNELSRFSTDISFSPSGSNQTDIQFNRSSYTFSDASFMEGGAWHTGRQAAWTAGRDRGMPSIEELSFDADLNLFSVESDLNTSSRPSCEDGVFDGTAYLKPRDPAELPTPPNISIDSCDDESDNLVSHQSRWNRIVDGVENVPSNSNHLMVHSMWLDASGDESFGRRSPSAASIHPNNDLNSTTDNLPVMISLQIPEEAPRVRYPSWKRIVGGLRFRRPSSRVLWRRKASGSNGRNKVKAERSSPPLLTNHGELRSGLRTARKRVGGTSPQPQRNLEALAYICFCCAVPLRKRGSSARDATRTLEQDGPPSSSEPSPTKESPAQFKDTASDPFQLPSINIIPQHEDFLLAFEWERQTPRLRVQ